MPALGGVSIRLVVREAGLECNIAKRFLEEDVSDRPLPAVNACFPHKSIIVEPSPRPELNFGADNSDHDELEALVSDLREPLHAH